MGQERESVAIIGGLGRMGGVTKTILERAGFAPLISDIKDPKTLSPREAIRNARIIFFSVLPIENIPIIIQATADVFNADHKVMDNATLKTPLRPAYEILDAKGASVCSTHPLCKDDQPLHGQNVLIVPFGENPHRATLIAEEVYQKAGMVLIRFNFDEHDSRLLVNQLPHLVNRAVGLVLADMGVDPEVLDEIATANSRLSMLATWRTLVQNPKISATIVEGLLKQPEGKKIVADLKNAITRIADEGTRPGTLERTFANSVELLDPTGQISLVMNDKTITVLERLANLRLRSVVVESTSDRPGLLRAILKPFEKAGIDLNAIDSHRKDGGIRFELGVASGTITPEVIQELEKLGFHVTNLRVAQTS